MPLPPAVKSSRPESDGVAVDVIKATLATGMPRPSRLNEYVPFSPTQAAPDARPPAFTICSESSRMPSPSRRTADVAVSNGSPYATPSTIAIWPKP